MAAPTEKLYGIANIKAYIPLVLDLDELNYDAWRELFQTHCVGFKVIDHIDGSVDGRPDDRDWSNLDSIVKMWIYGTISKSLLTMILKKNVIARDVWLHLEALFRDNKDARAIQIDNELHNIQIGDCSITDYCKHIKALADLLDNIDNTVPEKNLVSYMINGLSTNFENVATIIRHKKPLPSFLEARSMLILEEQ